MVIGKFIEKDEIKIPIVHIKDHLYLIGVNRCTCELKGTKAMIRVGGGYEQLKAYVLKYQKYFARALVINMVKSEQSLEYVIN